MENNKKVYSDIELLSLMEENKIEQTYENLIKYRKNPESLQIKKEKTDDGYSTSIKKGDDTLNVDVSKTPETKATSIKAHVSRPGAEEILKAKAVETNKKWGNDLSISEKKGKVLSTIKTSKDINNTLKETYEVIKTNYSKDELSSKENFKDIFYYTYNILYPLSEKYSAFNRYIGPLELENHSAKFYESYMNKNKSYNLNERKSDEMLKRILIESGMLESEYAETNTESKISSIKAIAVQILKNINDKLSSIDTSSADKSRGDIKLLQDLPALQNAISQLEALIERDENALPEYSFAISTIVKSILYLNQYSSVFKEAYRNKKTLLILKYQSIILSLISSISYLISVLVEFKTDTISLKRNVENIMQFMPLITLKNFIDSVDNGEFKKSVDDTNIIREFFLEIPVDKMSTVLEANDYLTTLTTGIKNLYTGISNNGKIINIIYKAVGVITLLISLRTIFYSLFRMKTKVSEMLTGIQNFTNINNGGNILSKLNQFASKFKNDAEFGSDLGKREVEDENRKLLTSMREIQRGNNDLDTIPIIKPEVANAVAKDGGNNIFGFDF